GARPSEAANRLALRISKIGGVWDQQSSVLAEPLRRQVFLVDEVEEKPPFDECIVQSLEIVGGLDARGRLSLRVAGLRPRPRLIKSNRALRIQHRQISDRTLVAKMWLVGFQPVIERVAHIAPAVIFG